MISSISNSQIKNIIQLSTKVKARKEQDCFIVEGIKMFVEIPKQEVISVFVSESFFQDNNKKYIENYSVEVVSDKIFKSLSDTVTPQGILAIVRAKHYNIEEILSQKVPEENKCFLILENIRDPGNLGTIIRTGEGAGISGIIINRESVDIYNPKVIRSTMGSIFRVPFVYVENLSDAIELMKKNSIKIYAAHLEGNNFYQINNTEAKKAVIIGNESSGISNELKNSADELIKIPMCGNVESLNAAISAAVIMYGFLHKC